MFVDKSPNTRRAVVGRIVMAAFAILLSSANAQAGHITIDVAGMNAIFSQASFDDTPIRIRFNAPVQIVAPQLLVINTLADLQALYSLAPDPAPTVDAFFVDQLNACGIVEPTSSGHYNGCAQLPGNFLVEDSTAAGLNPAELMGHELGHNLDLQHLPLGLMTPNLGFGDGFSLFDFQVATILQSPLVQTDSTGQRFIEITPIAIVDSPEPSTLLLVSAALGAVLIIKKKNPAGTRHSRPHFPMLFAPKLTLGLNRGNRDGRAFSPMSYHLRNRVPGAAAETTGTRQHIRGDHMTPSVIYPTFTAK